MRGRGFGPPKAARSPRLNFDSPTPSRFTASKSWASSDSSGRSDEPAYGPEWAATRKKVLQRDNYTCTNSACRVVHRPPYHGRLDAHHIRARREGGPDTVDNLRTLCKPCHAREHKHLERMGYGQPKKRRQ